jgi:hypothetical protein
MQQTFKSESQRSGYAALLHELRAIGYIDDLLIEDYHFGDWFTENVPDRKIAAAAFAQSPASYDSACFGVAVANGVSGNRLASQYRALGAPLIFEIGLNSVREWAIGIDDRTTVQISDIPFENVHSRFVERASDWAPAKFLRSKNVGEFVWNRQLELFAGVLPELESQIQEKLSPMLRSAMSAASSAYRSVAGANPDPERLFKLIFSLLTGKVFHDRDVQGFRNLDSEDGPDAILAAVAKHYKQPMPRLLNRQSRDVALSRIWSTMDFRNISVDVLAQIWSTSLVTDDVRKKLGIHKTPRTIAKYILDRIEFETADNGPKTVLEPCCGSAVFLIAAMNRLRSLQWGLSSRERHSYFTKHLIGYDVDPFGVEISRLALTLSDFPNPNGWKIVPEDVFARDGSFSDALKTAGVVLCNPPFESFSQSERKTYDLVSDKKPVELLHRVLADLHPSGVLGFVLPRNIIDGRGYRDVRAKLARRFSSIEITSLPDQAFEADHEVALLIAQSPISHRTTTVRHRHVLDTQENWNDFKWRHEVSDECEVEKNAEECKASLAIPQLAEVWESLREFDRLDAVAELHRGIEWSLPLTKKGKETGNRERLVINKPKPGFALGVPPGADVYCFTVPALSYLDIRPDQQRRNSYEHPWDVPKVILNAITKSRRGWRIAAFADHQGLIGHQNITGVWPKQYDIELLAAVLNGPVANAFVATREGKKHITIETLKAIPVPSFSPSQQALVKELVAEYKSATHDFDSPFTPDFRPTIIELLLKRIDAEVLSAYDLPPRIERQLLDFFNGQSRAVPFEFTDYFPSEFESWIPLRDYLSDELRKSTATAWRQRMTELPRHILDAFVASNGLVETEQ